MTGFRRDLPNSPWKGILDQTRYTHMTSFLKLMTCAYAYLCVLRGQFGSKDVNKSSTQDDVKNALC